MTSISFAQEDISFQRPPEEILKLVDFERAPLVFTDSKKEQLIFAYRDTYKSLIDLNQPEIRLAGLRINPITNISSTITYFNNIRYKKINDSQIHNFTGLPENLKIAYFEFSPDETKAVFTNTVESGVELWLLDFKTLFATRLTQPLLSSNSGKAYQWYSNGEALLVKMLPENKPKLIPSEYSLPDGPTISVSTGQISQNRTYQDLLKNKNDENNFNILITSELYKVKLDGTKTLWGKEDRYTNFQFSPDGNYVIVSTLKEPYSYVVPFYLFSEQTDIYSNEGELIKHFNLSPLSDNLPVGFMAVNQGKRNIDWRSDKPATLYWVEALDKGDPQIEVDFRDELYQLNAPFNNNPVSMAKTIGRFAGVVWGNDQYALLYDRWWNSRNQKTYIFNPSNSSVAPKILFDRNYQEVYTDPGSPQTEENRYGRYTLKMDGNSIYFFGDCYSAGGQFPFIDKLNLNTQLKERIYQSTFQDKLETLYSFIDSKKGTVFVRVEAPSEYPNFYIRDIKRKTLKPVTSFENPFKSISEINKEVITYQREDGVELTGTLYLPAGYDKQKKEKLPMIMWAYPTEYKDKNSAGQSTSNPNEFTYLSYGNPIYWVTRGYAILDNASFPIIGEGNKQPNDTFIEQLIANAKAAIDAVDSLGYIDRERVAVGGHSYGAFMTANLLTHSNLFAAGIARSGAYNRSLTPFGFQSEERSYWVAKDVYDSMSPFMHADKMKTPLLLTHGEADNNSGTHTMQSERYFQALKSFGAPVRLVILPKESHGYVAKENILHLLWEQDQWLEKYVKNKMKPLVQD